MPVTPHYHEAHFLWREPVPAPVAGEHTSLESQGYLNGAVESGQRAAGEVLASLGAKRLKAA